MIASCWKGSALRKLATGQMPREASIENPSLHILLLLIARLSQPLVLA